MIVRRIALRGNGAEASPQEDVSGSSVALPGARGERPEARPGCKFAEAVDRIGHDAAMVAAGPVADLGAVEIGRLDIATRRDSPDGVCHEKHKVRAVAPALGRPRKKAGCFGRWIGLARQCIAEELRVDLRLIADGGDFRHTLPGGLDAVGTDEVIGLTGQKMDDCTICRKIELEPGYHDQAHADACGVRPTPPARSSPAWSLSGPRRAPPRTPASESRRPRVGSRIGGGGS